jgi:vesicle transport protein SEC22
VRCVSFVTSGALTFVTACERKYPKKLALMYLEEVEREFSQSFPAPRVAAASEPFACQAFETFISKSKALYEDTSAQHDVGEMAKVQNELNDVHRILSQNVQDIIDRGAKIENVALKSEDLFAESRKFHTQAHDLRLQQIWRKYRTYGAVGLGVVFVVLVRFYLLA